MTDYLKYWLSPVLIGINMWGFWQGGIYVGLGLAVLLGILFFDMLLPRNFKLSDQRFPWIYDLTLLVTVLFAFSELFFYCYLVGIDHFATTTEAITAFIAMMLFGFVVGAPPGHELLHRNTPVMGFIGEIGMCLVFDPWRKITHVVTHHLKVATDDDPDTARRGENFYVYLVRNLSEQVKEVCILEREMWTKRSRSWWDPRNHWVISLLTLVTFSAALYLVGGLYGMLATIATLLIGPRVLLEAFNYVNHYGLVTECPGNFQNRHTWNHLTPFVRILALEITNHAGHHQDAYKPFYALVPDEHGPLQPQFLLCVILAFFPPAWFATIKPLLKDWDNRFATPKERILARAANKKAGWEDWFADDGSSQGNLKVKAA
jgi:fatty-acid desaturase